MLTQVLYADIRLLDHELKQKFYSATGHIDVGIQTSLSTENPTVAAGDRCQYGSHHTVSRSWIKPFPEISYL